MSLILLYLEVPDMPPQIRTPKELATFAVEARFGRVQGPSHPALAITDGVASDLFFAFGHNTRGRAGAKLRRALIEFIRARQGRGTARIYLKPLLPSGRVRAVAIDVDAAEPCRLGRLKSRLKTLQVGETLEVTNARTRN
jgi:hypothetical protein